MAPAIQIACLLGRVASPDAEVNGNPTPNSTKWIFDVEQDTTAVQTLHFQILDARTGRPKDAALLSFALTALDEKASEARLRVPHPSGPDLTIEANKVGRIRYRVSVDAVHSLSR